MLIQSACSQFREGALFFLYLSSNRKREIVHVSCISSILQTYVMDIYGYPV